MVQWEHHIFKKVLLMKLTSLLRTCMTRSRKPFLFLPEASETLSFREAEPLGLYVHIPFCRSICGFCPYCKTLYDLELARSYKDALLREITLAAGSSPKKKEVTSLYFGGGTPALMLDGLEEIIGHLRQYFTLSEGIGVELHPDDITPETLSKLRGAGVTMVSIGIQSFDEGCLRALGRKSSGADLAGKLALAASCGFDVVDVDLIFAIPTQTSASLRRDMDTAFSNGATQISTYPFIDFSFADNRYKPMPEREKKRLLHEIGIHAAKLGAQRTSVWTFARPGTQKYSSVTRDFFLGFGASAVTLLRSECKLNTFSAEDYIRTVESGKLPTSLTLRFTPRQRACYFLFWNCYSMRIDPEQFERVLGLSLRKTFRWELLAGRMLGLLKKEKGGYALTERGAYRYHTIEQAYTAAYIDQMWRVSRNTAFPGPVALY